MSLQSELFSFLFVSFVLFSAPGVGAPGPGHLASDSDSEVYCDSVDQFGQEEARNCLKRSI